MTDLNLYKEDFALMFEAGLVAIKQGDEDSAKKIFQSLHVLDPDHYGSELGFALIDLHKMDLSSAESRLRALEDQEGDNWSIKAFLAVTHMMIVLHQETSFDARKDNLERCVMLAQQVITHCEIELKLL